jgi:cyclopropane fatty-acyl-phospholipid synthase-like methyltransferase
VTPPELLEFLKDRRPGRAIDLGCGTGTNVITLTRLGWQVTGVDFIPAAIRQAEDKLKKAGLAADLKVGDVTRLEEIAGPFDLALDLGCFHSLPEREQKTYLGRLKQLMAPGGTWFLYAFVRQNEEDGGIGLTPGDLNKMQAFFHLRKRLDGQDRGQRLSAYFIFESIYGEKNK